ncbi:MAG: sigma-70 family RNA polymerase sigma factor [Lachnospiraceae bacterium]|nr:sigma-70 family RNA polymerase sigma factor [Lachnospiraceae bacterium]
MEINQIEDIVDQYDDMVYRIALFHTGNNREDANDIFQDVFLTLIKKRMYFNSSEHCKAWLIRVTINLCKKNYSQKKEILLGDEEIERTISKNSTYKMSVESEDLYEAICKLPPKYKNIIILFYFENMTCKEISRCIGIKEVSVRKRLSRARGELRMYMEEGRKRNEQGEY